jgi:hypothetical protein
MERIRSALQQVRIHNNAESVHNTKDLLHDKVHVLGFDKDGDGVDSGRLEPLDGVTGHVKDTMLAFLSHSLQNVSPSLVR